MALERRVKEDVLYLLEQGQVILEIKETLQNNQVTMQLAGNLRSDTEHELQDELVALATLGMDLVLDMAQVEYISAACQQVLLSVQQKMDALSRGTMKLVNLNQGLMEEFEKTGLSELLMIGD